MLKNNHCAKCLTLLLMAFLVSCEQEMAHQRNIRPLQEQHFTPVDSQFFSTPTGSVARNEIFVTPQQKTSDKKSADGENIASKYPFPITLNDLKRGRERYEIFCVPCHGFLGNADGIVVQRGYPKPVSFHEPGIKNIPEKVLYEIISNGLGDDMPRFNYHMTADDRWRVIAYIRVLQTSQEVPLSKAPEALKHLDRSKP